MPPTMQRPLFAMSDRKAVGTIMVEDICNCCHVIFPAGQLISMDSRSVGAVTILSSKEDKIKLSYHKKICTTKIFGDYSSKRGEGKVSYTILTKIEGMNNIPPEILKKSSR